MLQKEENPSGECGLDITRSWRRGTAQSVGLSSATSPTSFLGDILRARHASPICSASALTRLRQEGKAEIRGETLTGPSTMAIKEKLRLGIEDCL